MLGDFLYADGSLKLLFDSLASSLGFKTRGDRAENFCDNLYKYVQWPDETNRKIVIFLDNAQAITDYPPVPLQCLFDSYKAIQEITIRFVTSAPSCLNQYHINLSHLPVVEFHIPAPSVETTKVLISRANPKINAQFLHVACQSLFMACKSPNILLSIISDAWLMYDERRTGDKFDSTLAKECLNRSSGEKLGNVVGENLAKENENSFDAMPLAMRYLLIAAYCASNNPHQSDCRFFVKNHGREKRSEKKELRLEENRLAKDLGPKAADLQRIICIYETLLKINESTITGFDLKSVIASLDSMGLVSVTNRSNLDIPKIKCLISLESALKISRSLNLELRNYLEHAT